MTGQRVKVCQRHEHVLHKARDPWLSQVSHVRRPASVGILQLQECCSGGFGGFKVFCVTRVGMELTHHV